MQLLNCVIVLLGLSILLATFGPFITIAHRVTNCERGPENKLEHGLDKTRTDEETRSNVFAIMEKDHPKDARSKLSSGRKK
ncbi:hypothetical protein GUJ93_ZPchr0012g21284 [Zizania palustris]|uniref:Secreted protein n=1 Tax=Zizania palustris TaxID=103762 RepID=A0A8J5WQI4_ZIZPA|nr:hypothetical protein GUJ93_ZPchr0012g21284 [Zizania palustris]